MASSPVGLKFWGVRGSVPTPGRTTAGVGGNTSCVEFVGGPQRVLFDAGTGLRELGREAIAHPETEIHILLSHYHWDHMLGLPFFPPIFNPRACIHLYGEHKQPGGGPHEALMRQFQAPHFPVAFDIIQKQVHFHEIKAGDDFKIGPTRIQVGRLNHPQGAISFKARLRGKTAVYASDHEHDGLGDKELIRFARNADAIIYDAMFTDESYAASNKKGWGHSTWQEGVRVVQQAKAKRLFLFHHDPIHDDKKMAAIQRAAHKAFAGAHVAREGQFVEL
jgi:phosphoribosyl 1,2-cyclic phosphodiesterase